MNPDRVPLAGMHPALRRLSRLVPLDPVAVDAIGAALRQTTAVPVRHDVAVEGKPVGPPRILVEGWAARVRVQIDGGRQFLSFLLPGDLIGLCHQPDPLSISTITALTPVKLCPAPAADLSLTLEFAYATSMALEQAYLLDQIARLGRLNSQDRLLSLLLELNERLELAGLAVGGSFDMPLTQEQMADALGLTNVHINRMIQQARREVGLEWSGKQIRIKRPDRLAHRVGRSAAKVSGSLAV